MIVTQHYDSPLGGILLAADEIGLRGLWFDGQKYFARGLPGECVEGDTPALSEAKRWLDIYFTGKEPDFLPPLHPVGSLFRQSVWEILLRITFSLYRNPSGNASKISAKKTILSTSPLFPVRATGLDYTMEHPAETPGGNSPVDCC